jgi:hypothetical protein
MAKRVGLFKKFQHRKLKGWQKPLINVREHRGEVQFEDLTH